MKSLCVGLLALAMVVGGWAFPSVAEARGGGGNLSVRRGVRNREFVNRQFRQNIRFNNRRHNDVLLLQRRAFVPRRQVLLLDDGCYDDGALELQLRSNRLFLFRGY